MTTYRIPEMTDIYANHEMIQTHAELPPLSSPRLRMLHAALAGDGSMGKHSELYTLATSLVQLGMDTHDLIDTDTRRRTEKEMRTRQLNVLAGDYFSSRFYQLLASAGQIDMIARISSAVCEVNRLKVNLYMRMRALKVSADDYFGYAVQLKSELFQHFAELLGGTVSRLWPELLSGISRCEVALEEMGRSGCADRFERSWAYWHVLQVGTEEERHLLMSAKPEQDVVLALVDKYGVRKLLAAKLDAAAEAVKHAASKLESDRLVGELTGIAEHFLSKLGAAPALNESR